MYITRQLTEEFFDKAKDWSANFEKLTIGNHIRQIDIYSDWWTFDETFLIQITFNKWKAAEKAGRLIAWMFSMSSLSEIDIYRENKTLFLRLLGDDDL